MPGRGGGMVAALEPLLRMDTTVCLGAPAGLLPFAMEDPTAAEAADPFTLPPIALPEAPPDLGSAATTPGGRTPPVPAASGAAACISGVARLRDTCFLACGQS